MAASSVRVKNIPPNKETEYWRYDPDMIVTEALFVTSDKLIVLLAPRATSRAIEHPVRCSCIVGQN